MTEFSATRQPARALYAPMTADELYMIRQAMGMGKAAFGCALGLSGLENGVAARVRNMETGARQISQSVAEEARKLIAMHEAPRKARQERDRSNCCGRWPARAALAPEDGGRSTRAGRPSQNVATGKLLIDLSAAPSAMEEMYSRHQYGRG